MRNAKELIWFISLLLIVLNISCKKEQSNTKNDEILGTWISFDKIDTLEFVDKINFLKSDTVFRKENYRYSIDNDSIYIRYYDFTYSYTISPANHKYILRNDSLIIDFRKKGCFGFGYSISGFKREKP